MSEHGLGSTRSGAPWYFSFSKLEVPGGSQTGPGGLSSARKGSPGACHLFYSQSWEKEATGNRVGSTKEEKKWGMNPLGYGIRTWIGYRYGLIRSPRISSSTLDKSSNCGVLTRLSVPWSVRSFALSITIYIYIYIYIYVKKLRHYFDNKSPSSQSYGFSCSHVWM